jgi:hypothetical protein
LKPLKFHTHPQSLQSWSCLVPSAPTRTTTTS